MQHTHHIITNPNTGTDRRQNARCIGAAGGKRTPFLRMEKQSPSLTPTVIPVTWQPSSGRFFVGRERANGTRETLRCKDHCSHRPWEEEQPCDEELLTFWDSFLSFVIANSLEWVSVQWVSACPMSEWVSKEWVSECPRSEGVSNEWVSECPRSE